MPRKDLKSKTEATAQSRSTEAEARVEAMGERRGQPAQNRECPRATCDDDAPSLSKVSKACQSTAGNVGCVSALPMPRKPLSKTAARARAVTKS